MGRFASWLLAVLALTFATAAYPPSKATISLSPPAVAPGATVTATVCGFTPEESVVISIDGIAIVVVVAGPDGCATTSFAAPGAAGTATVAATGQTSGQTASTLLTIEGAGAVKGPTPTLPVQAPARLPFTGQSIDRTGRTAAGLLLAGAGVLIVSRRRRSDRERRNTPRRVGPVR